MRDGNPNRQDTILGGVILAGLAVTAVVAVLFTLVSWSGERAAEAPKSTVGSSTHASRPAALAPSTNSPRFTCAPSGVSSSTDPSGNV